MKEMVFGLLGLSAIAAFVLLSYRNTMVLVYWLAAHGAGLKAYSLDRKYHSEIVAKALKAEREAEQARPQPGMPVDAPAVGGVQ